ncbi:MAG: RsmE family RNA methyltransferase [Desulfomonile sp.]
MKPRTVLISPEELSQGVVTFSPRNARYLQKVLRLRAGDEVNILQSGDQYLVRLMTCIRGTVIGNVLQLIQSAQTISPEITLAFSCVRPGPIEEILRHGTELGISRFVPLITSRSNRRPRERKERWQFVVASAAAQSGVKPPPVVDPPTPFDLFIESCSGEAVKIVLSSSLGAEPLSALLTDNTPHEVAILVGPEGGLDVLEESKATQAGFLAASLGGRVLRTETAALLAAGIVALWADRLGGRGARKDS